jgi:hypothetical protein
MSSMMDFQNALAGGGAPPDAGMGPPPPDMGAPPPPDMGAPPPDLGAAGPPDLGAEAPPEQDAAGEGQQYGNSIEALDGAEEALHAFIQIDPDEADRAIAAKCLEQIIKLKAANQTSTQTGDLKSLQRALAGGGGY